MASKDKIKWLEETINGYKKQMEEHDSKHTQQRIDFWEGELVKVLSGTTTKIGASLVTDSGQCPKGSR